MPHHHHEHAHLHEERNFWEDIANHVKSGINDAETALGLPGVFKQQPSTQVITVYETASASGTGPIIGYKTGGQPPSSSPTPEAKTTSSATTSKAAPLVADTTSKKETTTTTTTHQPKVTTTSGLPSSIPPPSTTPLDINNLVAATNSPTHSTSSATQSPTPTIVAKSSGMSVGGEVGLSVGVLCIVGTIAGLLFFCFKKRRAAKKQQLDDEKAEPWGGPERQVSSRANAPRLSLGPILPTVGERRQSRNAPAMQTATHRPNSWEAPVGNQDGNRHNPFGAHAETIDAANSRGPPAVEVVNPEGAVVAAAGAGLTRGASKRENNPKPMDFTTKGALLPPISPVGTEFSMSSEANGAPTPTAAGAAIAAAGGPANSAVHRVQLDFKPSMDDELELRAGQLIRLLHEYDDGWALCIRLDRSRQGVVPRTCLSVRPVKPRPQQNGPRGPPQGMRGPNGQPRPMSPGMAQGGRMSPAMNQGRSSPNQGRMSPAMQGRMSPAMQGRPASPGNRQMNQNGPQYNPQPANPNPQPMGSNGPQPSNPADQARPSSPSAAQVQERRKTPPGPSPMNPASGQTSPVGRKPVPGQAM